MRDFCTGEFLYVRAVGDDLEWSLEAALARPRTEIVGYRLRYRRLAEPAVNER